MSELVPAQPDEARFVYITTADRAEALRIAEALLEHKLIACANVLPEVTSLFRWQGKVQRESECLLVAKARASAMPSLIAAVKAWHSYDCPCVLSLAIQEANPAYMQWLLEHTASVTAPSDNTA